MAKESASVPSGRPAAGLTTPRLDEPTWLAVSTRLVAPRSRLGNRGMRAFTACCSSGTSRWRISACFTAARISRRSVVASVGSTVRLTPLLALARVSPAARSFTGIPTSTEPSAATRPTRWASRAATPTSSALLVPPSDCARASHSPASTKIVAIGTMTGSSAPAGEWRRWRGSRRGGSSGTTAATPGQPDRGNDGAADSGDVARGLEGVLAHGPPPPSRRGGRPADRVVAAKCRIRQCLAQPDAVGERM